MTAPETAPRQTSPQRGRRWLRRAGIGLTAVLVIVVALVGLLQLPPVATLAVRKLLTLAPLNPGNRLEVGRVSGNFLGGLTLEDLRLHQDGRELAHIDRLAVRYRLPQLRPPNSRLDDLEILGGSISAHRHGDHWDLLDVMRKASDTTGGGEFAIGRLLVRDVAVAAELSPDSVAHARVQELAARDLRLGKTALAAIDRLQLAVQPPASERWLGASTRGRVTAEELSFDPVRIYSEASQVSGHVVLPRSFQNAREVNRLDVRLAARPLALADLAALNPSVPATGQMELDAQARGEGDLVTAHLAASLDRGRLTLDGGTRLHEGKPASYRVHGEVSRFDPTRLHASAPAGDLNARLDADVSGALSRAEGSVRLDLGGSRIGKVLVRQLRLGALLSSGTADLSLHGALDSGTVNATGRARPFDSLPTYRVSGTAVGMPGTSAVARTLAGADGDPSLAIAFRLAGSGTSPDSGTARGRVDLTAVRDTGARHALGHATLRLADGRLDVRPEILAGGGTITALGHVTLGDTLAYEVRDGRVDRVDLGKLSGDTTSAPLSGRFTLAGRGSSPQEAQLRAGLHFDELRYGSRRVERVDAVARLDQGHLRLTGKGAVQGGRLVLEALGRPFDSTASYVLRRAALEGVDLGTFLGRPDLAGPVTLSISGEARIRGSARSGQARLTVEQSRLGRVDVAGGTANLRLAGEHLDYDASVRTNGGRLSATGDGTPGAALPAYRIQEGRLTAVDLGTLLGRPDLHTDLNTTFTAEVTPGGRDSLTATLGVVLLPSRVNQAELTGGSLGAKVAGREIEATLRAQGPDADLDASVHGVPAQARTAFTANGAIRAEHLARWTGRADADGRLEGRFELTVEADTTGLRSVGGTVNAVGGVGGIRIPALYAALRPADGQVQLDTLLLRSNVAVLDGGGRLQLRPGPDPGTLRLVAKLGDMGPVAALMGVDTAGADSARIKLAVSGPARHWQVEGAADAYGLAYAGSLANHMTLNAKATLDSSKVSAVSGDLRVKDAAVGRLTLRELSAAGGYDSTLALDLKLNVGDSVRVESRVRGAISAARDTVRAELQRLTLDEGGRAWRLERPAAVTLGPRLEVDHLVLRAGDRSIMLNGVLDRRGTSDLTLRIASLNLETLRATGLVPVGGRLDGQLHLTGPAATPRLQGGVDLAILTSRGRQLGTVGTKLDWTEAGLRVSGAAKPVRGGALTIDGSLPYRLTLAPRDTAATLASEALAADTVSLAVRADSFDLSLFQPLLPPDAAKGLGGRLRADARIGGTIHAPQATGTVNLARATLELPTIRVAYQRGELAGRLEGDTLHIDKLRLLTGKHEELLASGAIRLTPLNDPSLALDGTLRDFRLVNSEQLRTSASGKVHIAGTPLQPVVTGRVRLGRTDFFVGAAAAQVRVEQVELTPAELRDLARDFGPAVLTEADKTPGLMDRAKLDLSVQMPGQVWIRRTSSPKTDIELTGNLRVAQEPGQAMQFFGHVEPVPNRGTLELNGKQFRLSDGDINLAGPVDSTKLDVNASYEVPTQGGGDAEGVLINVHARGRLDSLALDFTADPSMSQDDILSYIVTGRPASDNPLFEGSGTGGGNTGQQVAFGTLTGAISNAAGQGLGLDVFQIRQEPTRGLTLTAGRYVGSRLFLDLQLPLQLGSQSQQTAGSNLGPGFELEYTLQRWLRASLRGGSLSPGFLFRARRAY
ncbi:MAG: translocation/assembly module TamB domain-containing protein [Gemmatimonadales bacterium]